VLVAGFVLHLFNLNSFFGLTRTNPIKSGRVYAVFALVGFAAAILIFNRAF
jgi:hypothetical protein